jgi:hypothetical protein
MLKSARYNILINGFFRILTFIFISTQTLSAQTASEIDVKSAFILKVPLFVDWPEEEFKRQEFFTIAIMGQNPLEKALIQKIKKSNLQIKNKKILVIRIDEVNESDTYNILFISSAHKFDLNKILKKINKKPILTIGDTEGFADKGIMINMHIENSLNFQVNKVTADESGIYISSKLLVHAKYVIK